MFKSIFIAAAIVIASPGFVSAQDIFFSFSSTEADSTFTAGFEGTSGSVYIFSDGLFGFDALDLDLATSDSNFIRFTGGEAFDPTFNILGGNRFDSTVLSIDAGGGSGNLFSVNITQNGVDPVLGPLFDPGFVADVGPNGAFLLARVDFDIVGFGNEEDLEFTLGTQGAFQFPDTILNPSFGSATVIQIAPKIGFCTGDVNQSGTIEANFSDGVDLLDIAPFIAVLASGSFQQEADCNNDGVVNFFDIFPFIVILGIASS